MRRVVSAADLAVACPLCHALPGQPCRSTGGHGPMPGVIHRERAREARRGRCVADDPLGDCQNAATVHVRAACLHEHIREGWICDWHAERWQSAYCRPCHEDGHDCKLLTAMEVGRGV